MHLHAFERVGDWRAKRLSLKNHDWDYLSRQPGESAGELRISYQDGTFKSVASMSLVDLGVSSFDT